MLRFLSIMPWVQFLSILAVYSLYSLWWTRLRWRVRPPLLCFIPTTYPQVLKWILSYLIIAKLNVLLDWDRHLFKNSVDIFCSNFGSKLLFTAFVCYCIHNFCFKLFFGFWKVIFIHNFCWQNLFRNFVNIFVNNFFTTSAHSFWFQLVLTTFIRKFRSQILFTTHHHKFAS